MLFDIAGDPDGPLFRTAAGKTGKLRLSSTPVAYIAMRSELRARNRKRGAYARSADRNRGQRG
jgi:hypothetical protein